MVDTRQSSTSCKLNSTVNKQHTVQNYTSNDLSEEKPSGSLPMQQYCCRKYIPVEFSGFRNNKSSYVDIKSD